MNKQEMEEFIEKMEEAGDVWELDDVKRVYGDKTLEYALKDRMNDMQTFGGIISTVLNKKK